MKSIVLMEEVKVELYFFELVFLLKGKVIISSENELEMIIVVVQDYDLVKVVDIVNILVNKFEKEVDERMNV